MIRRRTRFAVGHPLILGFGQAQYSRRLLAVERYLDCSRPWLDGLEATLREPDGA